MDLRPLGAVVVVVASTLCLGTVVVVVVEPVPPCGVDPQFKLDRSAVPELATTVPSDHVPCVDNVRVPVALAGRTCVNVALW